MRITITWNLVLGSVCLFTVLIDLIFSHINWITVLNTFAATSNLLWYIIVRQEDKLFAKRGN